MRWISGAVNLLLGCLKWPTAVACLIFLPAAGLAVAQVFGRLASQPATWIPLAAGAAVYITRHLLYRRRIIHHLAATMIHELVHALFSVLTFHRVVAIAATSCFGGKTTQLAKGNWLISASPYFVYLPSLLVCLLFAFGRPQIRPFVLFGLGFALAFDLTANLRQLHLRQTDLKEVGWLFALMMLPGANVLVLGMILTVAASGLHAALELPAAAVAQTVEVILSVLR